MRCVSQDINQRGPKFFGDWFSSPLQSLKGPNWVIPFPYHSDYVVHLRTREVK